MSCSIKVGHSLTIMRFHILQVTTLINLLPIVEAVAGKEMGSEASSVSEPEFERIVDTVFNELEAFSHWAPAMDKGIVIFY